MIYRFTREAKKDGEERKKAFLTYASIHKFISIKKEVESLSILGKFQREKSGLKSRILGHFSLGSKENVSRLMGC